MLQLSGCYKECRQERADLASDSEESGNDEVLVSERKIA